MLAATGGEKLVIILDDVQLRESIHWKNQQNDRIVFIYMLMVIEVILLFDIYFK